MIFPLVSVNVTRATAENVAPTMACALVHVTNVLDPRVINAQNAQLTHTGKMENASVMTKEDSSLMQMDVAFMLDLVTATVMETTHVVVQTKKTVISALTTHSAIRLENVNAMNTGTTSQKEREHAAALTLDHATGDVQLVLDPQTWTV